MGLRGSLVRAAQIRGQPGVVPGGAVPQRLRARLLQRELPRGWPAGRFDLIVFSEFLAAGGFRPLRTAEDHMLLAAATEAGCADVQARDITVETSGRRWRRAPRGFSNLLRTLADGRGSDEAAAT